MKKIINEKWWGAAYFGCLFVLISPIYFSLDKPVDRLGSPTKVYEGTLNLIVIKHKGTTSYQPELITETGRVPLYCGAPAYVDCYPGILQHKGLRVEAAAYSSANGAAELYSLKNKESGQLLIGPDYFQNRKEYIKKTDRYLTLFFCSLGALLISIAVYKSNYSKEKPNA